MSKYKFLEIREEGDITITKLFDKKILDEANIWKLGDELIALVEKDGCTKIILDFSNVEYISSSGLVILIKFGRKLKAAEGRLIFCELGRVYEVFEITKMNKAFEICSDVDAALARFAGLKEKGLRIETHCPVDQCGMAVTHSFIPESLSVWSTGITCPKCATTFMVENRFHHALRPEEFWISSLTFPTYENQSISVSYGTSWRDGAPFVIHAQGHLDLFASESLEKAWRTIPSPRCASVNLDQTTELTNQGLAKLRKIFEARGENDKCVVEFIRNKKPDLADKLPVDLPVCYSTEEVLKALGNLPEDSKQPITIAARIVRESAG